MSPEKLAAEIMYLSALVNAKTELCVFVRYSGHVDTLAVDIAESKKNYQSKIFDGEAYTNNKKGIVKYGSVEIEEIRNELVQVLADHNVPYEMLDFAGQGGAVPVEEAVTEGPKLEDRITTLEKEMAELKGLVSVQLARRVAADVPKELPRGRGDHQGNEDRLEDRLQEAL